LLDRVYAALQRTQSDNEQELQLACDEASKELAGTGAYYADTTSDEAAKTTKLNMLVATFSRQYSSLEQRYRSVDTKFNSLEEAYRALEKHPLSMQEENKGLTEEIWKQRDAQLKLEAMLGEAQADLVKTNSELWNTKVELTAAQAQIEATYQSTSWQITKPLRTGAALLKSLTNK
jgi:chromosome segregation ATPase